MKGCACTPPPCHSALAGSAPDMWLLCWSLCSVGGRVGNSRAAGETGGSWQRLPSAGLCPAAWASRASLGKRLRGHGPPWMEPVRALCPLHSGLLLPSRQLPVVVYRTGEETEARPRARAGGGAQAWSGLLAPEPLPSSGLYSRPSPLRAPAFAASLHRGFKNMFIKKLIETVKMIQRARPSESVYTPVYSYN